ncbi:hypothetical protein N8988_05325 [Opitutales bacterium]|nr:hypothetical protein [Opitutales bacterium]
MGSQFNIFFPDQIRRSINDCEEDDLAFEEVLTTKINHCVEDYFLNRSGYEEEAEEMGKLLREFIDVKKSDAANNLDENKGRLDVVKNLKSLRSLVLSCCDTYFSLESIGGLDELEQLELMDCQSLFNLGGLDRLHNLKKLFLRDCFSLVDISALAILKNLEFLLLDRTFSLAQEQVDKLGDSLPNCQIICRKDFE